MSCRFFTVAAILAVLALCLSCERQSAQGEKTSGSKSIPAFPGAEGFGSLTPGGRGGRVIEVTNLNPDGPGSLRAALLAKGPRIVVFRVGGTIRISRDLNIPEPFITIAGQTAPGDGICLRGCSLRVGTHDVVIRYLRVRTGDDPEGPDPDNRDCIDIAGPADKVYNVVIDHCSFSWSIDENVTTWYGPRNVTIQWCISSESLDDSLHPKGPHGKGMLLGSQDNTVSVHHCLLAHNTDRNPLMGDTGKGLNKGPSLFDFRNNVIYNHGRWGCSNVRGTSRVNYVGNYIKMGPDDDPKCPRGLRYDAGRDQLFFVSDNIWPGMPKNADDLMVMGGVLGEQWRPPPAKICSSKPIPAPPVTTQPPAEAYEAVLNCAGAVLPVRDVIDARIVQEVRTGTGHIIDSQADVGGWPEYRSAPPPADSDHDGMPDDWEKNHRLNPRQPLDGPEDADGDGYTNVEEFLNGTDPRRYTAGTPTPCPPVRIQQGNEHLRFGKARKTPPQPGADAITREEFIRAVKASGKDVADYVELKMLPVTPGEFMINDVKVIITKPYELSACEITQAQWTKVMGSRPWREKPWAKDSPRHPATYVSWKDCQEFISRLNACSKRTYRLPTEAEWEYACRAGSTSKSGFYFDEKHTPDFAWCYDNTLKVGEKYPHPVGRKKPNAWGFFDMAGNVYEWCSDYYGYWYWDAKHTGPVRKDPTGAKPGSYYREYRIVRSGSFNRRPYQLFAYPRSRHRPDYRNFDVGFRLCRSAGE